jgi:heme-degrading monooxygenase HmoA
MHARVNMIFGEKAKVEVGVAQLEDTDRRGVEAMDGNLGLTTMTDRDAGVILAVSYWDEPTHSSEATLTRAREDAAAAAGGDLVVESYEVVAQHVLSNPPPGAVVRMGRVRIDSATFLDGSAFVRNEVLPELRAGAGLCTAELMLDEESSTGLLFTVWASETEATQVDTVLDRLQDEATERVGITVARVETYALVRSSKPAD